MKGSRGESCVENGIGDRGEDTEKGESEIYYGEIVQKTVERWRLKMNSAADKKYPSEIYGSTGRK